MAEINPFEPWRPAGRNDEPPPRLPDDDFLRPWRDARRNAEGDVPAWAREPELPTEPLKQSSGFGSGFIWLTVLLVVVAAVAWAANGASHYSRVVAAGLALWVGLLFACAIGRRWRWYPRLAFAAAGLAALVACWYFVPTMEGNSLLDAERVLRQTHLLQPGDTNAFRQSAKERADVAADFSRFQEAIRNAERSWVRRTIDQEARAAEQERDRDPDSAMKRLTAVLDSVRGTQHHGEVHWELNRARQQVLAARLSRAESDLGARITRKEFRKVTEEARRLASALRDEARELDQQGLLDERVKAIRERNLRAHSRVAEAEVQSLLREERFAEVAAAGKRAVAELLPEAVALGDTSGVISRLQQARRTALLARVKQGRAALEALVSKNDYESVPTQAARYESELADENNALKTDQDRNPADLPAVFFPMREKALTRRAERAGKALEESLAKKDYVGVASRGGEVMRELEPEGRALSKSGWGDRIRTARRKALAARLDLAREKSREQLKQKQYREMEATADKAHSELGLEAEVVGLSDEVKKFRDVCRFYAKLAREAGE